MIRIRRHWPGIALGLALLLPRTAEAQQHSHPQPTWAIDLGVAGANIVAGGVTAALTAAIRGHDLPEAFLKGAAGGGAVFVGKRVAVERFAGAGLLGREIAGLGSSMAANAGAGRSWLDEVWLPLGPAWIQVRPKARFRTRVNLSDVGTIVWAATRSELHFDLERSISNGSTVFMAPRHRIESGSSPVGGLVLGGVVLLGNSAGDVEIIQRHENVHVIQHDYLLHSMVRPLERWGWARITRRNIPVDLSLVPLLGYPKFLHSLHEREAEVLEHR